MAVDKGPKLDWGILANSDLSANQFEAVKFHATATIDTVVAISAATDLPLGVLGNAPKAGEEAEVILTGIAKVRCGGVVTRNDLLTIDADGEFVKATPGTDTTKYVVGRALESGVDQQVISAAVAFPSAYLAK